ncbi:uncharacterized protein LOC108906126 [Anoplophora glabripennis]|uniref:uncharacterized protein LOC108906126 n=1 Tax=Anoplophora glabripennis TaxID=217634 RepID=UPI000874BBDF|nr:uncharacterized protein LOC108906126 [Anoplophora glabripennis]
MSCKVSPRPRKRKQKEEMKEQIVAQVHKPVKSNTSSENDYANSEDNLESNKTYTYEDKNENISVHTPSRDVSVDEESQINSKILSLIETEMRRDINKHSHFTDSRPQSLSFYEDEKVPEELSGNLELLSPEERKHYKKRKEYMQMDTEERNAYNVMQDIYNSRDSEDIMASSTKKSKSRKKRHAESELGMGDSREMMIPKEKRKSKKKKRDVSPMAPNNTKRKHKKRDEDYELRNDITVALEELQDDVFESNHEEPSNKPERVRKSPRRSDKLYVQKKNKFEAVPKPPNTYLSRQGAQDFEDGKFGKRSSTYPLEIAILFQRWWMRMSTLSHGLLGGLALGHWLYLICNMRRQDDDFLIHYAYYSDTYVGLFFAMCVLCIVSVYDRIDIGHLEFKNMREIWKHKKGLMVVVLYITCLIVHLSTAGYDEQLSLLSYSNATIANITKSDLNVWNHLSLWRAILAFIAWIMVGLGQPHDTLYVHLKNMETYLPDK